MKTINLLPKEEKVKDIKSILLNMVLIILILILIAGGGFSFILFNLNNYLEPKLDNYKRVNMQINNYINKLKAYSEFKGKVEEKAQLVDYLLEEEIIWSDILYDFAKRVPRNAYVNYIEGNSENFYKFISEAEEKKPEEIEKVLFFTIGGYALDYTDVTKLLVQIRNMENIGEVWINNVSKNYITESNIEVLSFTISAYLDIEPYLESLKGKKETQTQTEEDEGVLDEELQLLNQ